MVNGKELKCNRKFQTRTCSRNFQGLEMTFELHFQAIPQLYQSLTFWEWECLCKCVRFAACPTLAEWNRRLPPELWMWLLGEVWSVVRCHPGESILRPHSISNPQLCSDSTFLQGNELFFFPSSKLPSFLQDFRITAIIYDGSDFYKTHCLVSKQHNRLPKTKIQLSDSYHSEFRGVKNLETLTGDK